MKKIFIVICVLISYNLVSAQSGTLDPAFGNGGFILTPAKGYSVFGSAGRQAFVNANGSISIVLQVGDKSGIVRLMPDGTLDANYHNKGYSDLVSLYLGNAVIQADGKIIVAGMPNQSSGFMLVRFNTDGTLDASFGNGGVTITNLPKTVILNAVGITSAGNIVVGGSSTPAGHSEFTLAQYSSSGTLIPNFGNQGIVTTDFSGVASHITALAIQPDGMIIAGGTVQQNGNGDFALVRYDGNGNLDKNFNSTGIVTSDFGSYDDLRALAIAGDGRIYAGGSSFDPITQGYFRMARYNTDGSPDASFNGGSVSPFPSSTNGLYLMKIQPDGKIVAAGATTDASGNQDIQITRLNTDGTLDNGFGNSGFVLADINSAQDNVSFLAFDSNTNILAGGDNIDYSKISTGNFESYSCFRFTTNGLPDIAFGNAGKINGYLPYYDFNYRSIFALGSGQLLALSGANAQNDNSVYLNRFNSDGSIDNSFGQNGRQLLNSSASSFFQPDGKILALSYAGAGDFNLTRYNTDGSVDATFGNSGNVITHFSGNEYPNCVGFQPDNKIIVGGFSNNSNGGSDAIITRYNSDGSLDATFGGGSGFIKISIDNQTGPQVIKVGPDGKIVIGILGVAYPPDFSYFYFDIIFSKLNSDGSMDQSFGNNGSLLYHRSNGDFPGSLEILNNNKIAFNYLIGNGNEGFTSSLQVLNADGTTDMSFGNGGSVPCDVGTLAIQPDGKILISGYRANSLGNLDFALTRFNTNGSPDGSFGNNGQTVIAFTDLDNRIGSPFLTSNSLFVSGNVRDKSGAAYGIIAKFRLDAASAITCPANKTVSAALNLCSAKVDTLDPLVIPAGSTFKYQLYGATIGSGNGTVTGKEFHKGATTVVYTLIADTTKKCSFNVTVQDKQLPVIDRLNVSQTILWPANHKFVDITVDYRAKDNCGMAGTQLSVSSNEPVISSERNDQSPDWQIIDNHHVRLRAEKLENGIGRTYTITVTATDRNGNQTRATIFVNVPKSINHTDCNLTLIAMPNPSHTNFQVRLKSACNDKINLRLINSNGVVLKTFENIISPQILTIGSNLSRGIYYLEAVQAGNTKSLKLIKQ